MSAFRRKGRRMHTIKVPTSSGAWIPRTASTRDRELAKQMQRMVDDLGPAGKRAWDVLDRVEQKTLELPTLYDKWIAAARDLEELRASLDDVDLEPYVATWHAANLGPATGMVADTADHYLSAVRLLIPDGEPFRRSMLTPPRLREWLDTMQDVKSGTVRKRGQGMRDFTQWLVARHVLAVDPMRDIALPPQGKPRAHFLETADAIRLADAQPSPYREFSALLAGSGVEVGVAVKLRVRDVDAKHKEIRAPGTKTHSRDRVVRVADWAWKYIVPLTKHRHPDARLFDEIADNRWNPQAPHTEAVKVLVAKGHTIYQGYTMRDQRHTYAVRAIRAGTPAELVAKQLGHANPVLVHTTYGRFAPNQAERDKWEKIAAEQDKAAAKKAAADARKRTALTLVETSDA